LKRGDGDAEELFKKLGRFRGKVLLVLIDGYHGYEKFIRKYLGSGSRKPITGVINKSKFCVRSRKFFTYGLFGVSGRVVDEVIREIGIGKEITTAPIENLNSFIRDSIYYLVRRTKRVAKSLEWIRLSLIGFLFFHNYIKAHWALSSRKSKNWILEPVTPGMACGSTNSQLSILSALMIPTYQL
jgi:hypothetical protein